MATEEIKFKIEADNIASEELAQLIGQIELLTNEVKLLSNVSDDNLEAASKTVISFLRGMKTSAELSAEEFQKLRNIMNRLGENMHEAKDDADVFVSTLADASKVIKIFNKGYKQLEETQQRAARGGMDENEYLKRGLQFKKNMVKYNNQLADTYSKLEQEYREYSKILERVRRAGGISGETGHPTRRFLEHGNIFDREHAYEVNEQKDLRQLLELYDKIKDQKKQLLELEKETTKAEHQRNRELEQNISLVRQKARAAIQQNKKEEEYVNLLRIRSQELANKDLEKNIKLVRQKARAAIQQNKLEEEYITMLKGKEQERENKALKDAFEFKKRMVKYNNQLSETYEKVKDEVRQYTEQVERLSKVQRIAGSSSGFVGHPGMAESAVKRLDKAGRMGNLDQMNELLKDVTRSRKHLSDVETQANKEGRESYNRLVEVVKRYVRAKSHGDVIGNEKEFARAIKLVGERAKATGATLKEVARAKDIVRKANDSAVKGLAKQQKGFDDLTKALSKNNVEYFTMTNILHDVEFGLERAFHYATRWMGEIIEAGGEMEKLGRTVAATEGSLAGGQERLNSLIEKSISLVGVSLQSIIKYNSQLRAAGLTTKQVDVIISGVGKSVAELGKSTYEAERILLQLTQGIAGNKIVLQDLRPILEEIPQFWNAASITFKEAVQRC